MSGAKTDSDFELEIDATCTITCQPPAEHLNQEPDVLLGV